MKQLEDRYGDTEVIADHSPSLLHLQQIWQNVQILLLVYLF
jgi:hypothetical protein